MKLFGQMTVEERAREAYETFTEEAQPYLFPEGEKDALAIIEALGEACGLRERDRGPRQCEDLLDLWAEMVRCTELDQNRNERIRLMRKKYGALVRNETVADRVCNWCEKKLTARFGEMLAYGGMRVTRFPEAEQPAVSVEAESTDSFEAMSMEMEPEHPETESPETEYTEEAEAFEPETAEPEPLSPTLPDPGAVARALKEAWNLKGQERKQTLEALKTRRKEWIGAAMTGQQAGARGAIGSIFLAGFAAAGGKTVDKAKMRDLLKAFLEGSEAEQNWSAAGDEWKKEALKAAWQLGARMGCSQDEGQDEEQDEGQGPRDEGQVENEVEETAEVEEIVTGETEDEKVWGNDL